MALIPLTRGLVAIVDDADFDWLSQFKWHVTGQGYARRSIAKRVGAFMHTMLLPTEPGVMPDHRNGNRLDNRRENLRPSTKRQNAWNTPARRCSSQYKGVSWDHANGRWSAHININGKSVRLGRFGSEDEAARAYDAAALPLQGEFARLNFPTSEAA